MYNYNYKHYDFFLNPDIGGGPAGALAGKLGMCPALNGGGPDGGAIPILTICGGPDTGTEAIWGIVPGLNICGGGPCDAGGMP